MVSTIIFFSQRQAITYYLTLPRIYLIYIYDKSESATISDADLNYFINKIDEITD
jgi:hypothetical protein